MAASVMPRLAKTVVFPSLGQGLVITSSCGVPIDVQRIDVTTARYDSKVSNDSDVEVALIPPSNRLMGCNDESCSIRSDLWDSVIPRMGRALAALAGDSKSVRSSLHPLCCCSTAP